MRNKSTVYTQIDRALKVELERLAMRENRSLANFIETVLLARARIARPKAKEPAK